MKYEIDIFHEQDIDPFDGDGNWTPYSFSRKHTNYKDPEEFFPDGQPTEELKAKLDVGLAFILSYYEHGNCAWMLAGSSVWANCSDKQWDGTRFAGLLVWENDEDDMGAKTKEDRYKDAEQFIEGYTEWCNGRVYSVCFSDDDCCHGPWFGNDTDDMIKEIREHIKDWPADQITITGDATYMLDGEEIVPGYKLGRPKTQQRLVKKVEKPVKI